MTRYEPHCDCLGGHVSMLPDPNGRWCRAEDPPPVADDPSGIVQQMPLGLIAWPCSWQYQRVTLAGGRHQDETVYIRADIARATEADLRAEVERLRVSLMAARKGLQGVKEMVLRGHHRNTIMQACETEQVKLDIALSPETDGGQL